eukprot:3344426-Amphidinium_carterae.1
MPYGGSAGDPQVTSDLNTIRAWQRKLAAGTLEWPLATEVGERALNKGRGRGPIRHLRLLADRLAWLPAVGGWRCEGQYFTWSEADYKVKWDSAKARQSVYRAELHAIARVVSDCKGAVKAVQALQTGRSQPKGRNRDLELRVKNALLPGQRIRWIKAHLTQADVDIGRITADDLHGNGQADILANA